MSHCVDIINVACVGNGQLRKAIEEALFIFPAAVSIIFLTLSRLYNLLRLLLRMSELGTGDNKVQCHDSYT